MFSPYIEQGNQGSYPGIPKHSYVARLGCRNWIVVALNREGWRKLLKEAEAHPGL
jgi:hypothetical protein